LNFYFLKINYDPAVGIGFVFLAGLIANLFYLFFFAKDLLSWRPAVDKVVTPTMVNYAYPVMLMGVVGMTNEMFSRLILEWRLPKNFYGAKSPAHALGVFAACYKFSVLMSIAIQAFRFAAEPFFFSNAADKNSPALFSKVNHYFVIVCCLLWLGVSINLDVLKYLFIGREEYWVGLPIVPILLLAYLFLGVYYNFSVWYKVTDKTYFGTIITAGGAVLTILLNYMLIPIAGYTGSSWAALIVYASMAVACYALGQKQYPIPYRILADLCYVSATSLLIFVISRITVENLWLSMGFHLGIILLFIAVIYIIERKGRMPSPLEQRATGQ
jgi:O-antigen/teichoic acid export membrane protein